MREAPLFSGCRKSRATATRETKNIKSIKKQLIIVIAGDTSNITCYLSLFSVSSLIVLLYADRLETKKYHCLFESLSACRLFIDTLKKAYRSYCAIRFFIILFAIGIRRSIGTCKILKYADDIAYVNLSVTVHIGGGLLIFIKIGCISARK